MHTGIAKENVIARLPTEHGRMMVPGCRRFSIKITRADSPTFRVLDGQASLLDRGSLARARGAKSAGSRLISALMALMTFNGL